MGPRVYPTIGRAPYFMDCPFLVFCLFYKDKKIPNRSKQHLCTIKWWAQPTVEFPGGSKMRVSEMFSKVQTFLGSTKGVQHRQCDTQPPWPFGRILLQRAKELSTIHSRFRCILPVMSPCPALLRASLMANTVSLSDAADEPSHPR